MKKIILFSLLPIIAFAQPQNQYQKEHSNDGFSIDITIESFMNNVVNFPEQLNGTIELTLTIEVFVEAMEFVPSTSRLKNHETVTNLPPKYLNTLSLVGLYSESFENNKPQERLNHLLSLNDQRFPKEDTLMNFLHPVTHTKNKIAGAENWAQGFGPLIRI